MGIADDPDHAGNNRVSAPDLLLVLKRHEHGVLPFIYSVVEVWKLPAPMPARHVTHLRNLHMTGNSIVFARCRPLGGPPIGVASKYFCVGLLCGNPATALVRRLWEGLVLFFPYSG